MSKRVKEQVACVGRFYRNERLPQCRVCKKCLLHLAYLYDGAPKPMYQRPSDCKRKKLSLTEKFKKQCQMK